MSHTKLPWKMVKNSWAITTIYDQDKQVIICESIIDEGDISIERQLECEDEQEANAAFIVKACNNYYQLLEALKLVNAKLDNREWNDSYKEKVMVEVREAIKEAE